MFRLFYALPYRAVCKEQAPIQAQPPHHVGVMLLNVMSKRQMSSPNATMRFGMVARRWVVSG